MGSCVSMGVRAGVLMALLAGGGGLSVRADAIFLRDGQQHGGRLISRNEREVVFRVRLDDHGSYIVRRFEAGAVLRVETGRELHTLADPAGVAESRSAGAAGSEDYGQMVREGFELVDDGDLAAAVLAMQLAVLRAGEADRPALEALCRETRGVELAELLAETRIRQALRVDGFHVRYATPYEAAALGRQLRARQEELLGRSFSGRSVAAWAEEPRAYDTFQADTRELVSAAQQAAGMLGVRIRLDPGLAEDPPERQRLVALRERLAELISHARALPGYTEPPESEVWSGPAGRAARRMQQAGAAASQPGGGAQP